MLEQISSYVITKPLLSIYNELLDVSIVDSKLAKVLPDIVSAQMLKLEQKGIEKIIVVYPELKVRMYISIIRICTMFRYIPRMQ